MNGIIIFGIGLIAGILFGAVLIFVALEVKRLRESKQAQAFFRGQADVITKAVLAQRKAEIEAKEAPGKTKPEAPGKPEMN